MNQPSLNTTVLATRVADELCVTRGIAYVKISNDLSIEGASDNFGEFISSPRGKIIGELIYELLWEFVGAEAGLKEILEGVRNDFTLERVNRPQPDGSTQYYDYRVVPWECEDPSQGLLLIIEDVTQSGQMELHLIQDRNELRLIRDQLSQANVELQRLNRLKSIFLSIAAHDLRSPLASIQGYVDLVNNNLSSSAESQNREFLTIVLSQTQQLNRLITDFLEMDEIEEGSFNLKLSRINLNELVQEVIDHLVLSADQKELTITYQKPKTPIWLEVDPTRLQQVFYNLLSNAVKYSPAGGQIQLITDIEAGQVVIKVRDSGLGIPKEELDRLFQLYYRTKDARKSSIGGTGLGLYIVRNLVEAHRGVVEVESEVGVGTTFTVRLPQDECKKSL